MLTEKYFLRVLQLAHSIKGSTSPNPAVGAIIVKNGEIISEGATLPPGGLHAEAMAIKKAGKNASDASMFISLEPCICFPGKRTPACSDLIINAGIKEVFIGSFDPNPMVYKKGVESLRKAGLKVNLWNVYQEELCELNEAYFKYVRTGLPFVTAKYAMTLDGNIATASGHSQWISGSESLAFAHKLRNENRAVLVGIGTVLNDNPTLNVRLVETVRNPLRVIIDPQGRTPADYNVMVTEEETIFLTAKDVSKDFLKICDKNHKQHYALDVPFDPHEVLKLLGNELEIDSLLIEGGGRVHYSFFKAGVVDKVVAVVAPKILGGSGLHPFSGGSPIRMDESVKLNRIYSENYGEDIMIRGYVNGSDYCSKIFQ